MHVKMLTSEWSIGYGGEGEPRAAEEGEIQIMYMNFGRSVDATHEFLKRCARDNVAISFVRECWVEKKSGKGTQSSPGYVCLGSVSGGARVACHV